MWGCCFSPTKKSDNITQLIIIPEQAQKEKSDLKKDDIMLELKIKKEYNTDFIIKCLNEPEVMCAMPRTSMSGVITWGYVTDVYDGDTLTITYRHGSMINKHQFRMLGFDAPEIKPLLSIENRALHMHAAKIARDKLKQLLKTCSNFVVIKFEENEKYGRNMGTLWSGHIPESEECPFDKAPLNVNEWCIEEGYGLPYDGGKKTAFTKEMLEIIVSKE